MNFLLVDDEPLLLRKLERAVHSVLPEAQLHPFIDARPALELADSMHVDVAFLDIRMRGLNGLELAKALLEKDETTNIIFCTGFAEYALEAYDVYASAYLLKPITAEQIVDAMKRLRHPLKQTFRVRIQCFGNFEAFCDGEPIPFKLSRTSELLAYLVDRNGAECRSRETIAVLFGDSDNREYYKKLRGDLIQTFTDLGILDCLYVTHGALSIIRDRVSCDYFDYKDGKITTPPTEYMTQYSFAEVTFAGMTNGQG